MENLRRLALVVIPLSTVALLGGAVLAHRPTNSGRLARKTAPPRSREEAPVPVRPPATPPDSMAPLPRHLPSAPSREERKARLREVCQNYCSAVASGDLAEEAALYRVLRSEGEMACQCALEALLAPNGPLDVEIARKTLESLGK